MSRKGRGGGALQKDAPWRSSSVNPVPKIHHSPILRLPQTPYSKHALSVVKHPNPIGYGMATEAIAEAAVPDCIGTWGNCTHQITWVKGMTDRSGLKFSRTSCPRAQTTRKELLSRMARSRKSN